MAITLALASVAHYGWETADRLEIRITEAEQAVSVLQSQLNAANGRIGAVESGVVAALDLASGLRSDVNALERNITDMQGFGWSTFSRGLGDLDGDLDTVESCLRSVVDILSGFGRFLHFGCSNIPFF